MPGDIISIKLGDIIPADARLLEGDPLKIDQVGLPLRIQVACLLMGQEFIDWLLRIELTSLSL